jgi:hypothetical protein
MIQINYIGFYIFLKICLIICCTVIVGVFILWFFQRRLIYNPNVADSFSRSPAANISGLRNPKELQMKFEDITLQTSDGLTLHGWHIR